MTIIIGITVFLGLILLALILLYFEERKHDKRERVRMMHYAAMYEAKHATYRPRKPIHEVV